MVTRDPADDNVVACAATVMTDFIISGDRHLLELRSFQGIPIVTPAEYVDQVGPQRGNRQ